MDKNAFESKYKALNDKQKEAVDTIFGPLMVVAGPGTGKTTLLAIRIANILKLTDTRPEQILALTFTESGVKAMKDKLREIIGSDALKVNIFTYHSFAEHILRRYNDYFTEFNNFRFIGEDETIILIEGIVDRGNYTRIKSISNPYYQVKNIISYLKELKREFIDVDSIKKYVDKYEDELKSNPGNYSSRGKTKGEIKSDARSKFNKVDKMREFAEVFTQYEEAKFRLKYYDFEDVINIVVEKVASNIDLQFEIAEEYQFILADEHQDANMSQNKILDFFGSVIESPNIMVVGDEKQAIFRFQGGTLENFTGFKNRYPNARVITLTDNFRSHQNILDYSFGLISRRSDLLINKENLVAKGGNVGDGKITFVMLHDKESECEYIAESIKRILNESSDDIAVIFRTNKEKDDIARTLDFLNINYLSHSNNELFENRYALEFVTAVKAFADLFDNTNFIKLLCSSVFNIGIEKIHKINKEIQYTSKTALDVIKHFADSDILDVVDRIEYLSNFAFKNSPVLFIEEFARKTDYLKTQETGILEHKLSVLRAFANIARQVESSDENANIVSLMNFIDKAIAYDIKINIPKDTNNARVTLMTAHKSKGLEFDHVYIMNMTHRGWDKSFARDEFIPVETLLGLEDSGEDLEDTRKLLYVAMTRAKKHLELTFPRNTIDGDEESVSGFVDEVEDDLLEKKVVDKKSSLRFLQEEVVTDKKIKVYREIFLSQSFSITALNNYLDCPNKFLFNNLLRFPFAITLSLEVGNAVHTSLEEFNNLILRNKEHTGEVLFALFDRNLDKKSIRDKDKIIVKKEYKDSIFDFAENGNLDDNKLFKAEFKLDYNYVFEFENVKCEVRIKGSVDRVDRNGESYSVIDFKTGKPKSRNQSSGQNENSDGNYLRQITFYKMIMEAMDNKMVVTSGQINFILLNESGKRVFHDFELTQDMVYELRQEMEGVFNQIMSGEFLTKGCNDKECEYCKLRKTINI